MTRRLSRSCKPVKRSAKSPSKSPSKSSSKSSSASGSERLFRTLLGGCSNPADLIELYYWSREPGMLGIIRSVVALSEESRAALETFLAMARDPKNVAVHWDVSGSLTLASDEVTKAFAMAEQIGENEGEDKPRVLN